MRTPVIALLFVILLVVSCEESPMSPSDEEMIRHSTTHEVASRKAYETMAEGPESSFHYPPPPPEEVIILDSMEQGDTSHRTNDKQGIPVYGLLESEQILLDSLSSEIRCGFILTDHREWGMADLIYASFVMSYYPHGIVDAGTFKDFAYDPGLRSRRNTHITERDSLNEIYHRAYNDTTLCKLIGGDWYIRLDHSI